MSDDSPAYDASLAAAIAVYDELFPHYQRNALMIGKLTFIILQALDLRTMQDYEQNRPS
jgi:hypothetical protein